MEDLQHHTTDVLGDLNDVYNDLSQLTVEERQIEVPLYDDSADPIYADPVDSLTLHVKLNGRRATFWTETACDCCETRPEKTVSRDVGTHVPFRQIANGFIEQILDGTAPRKHPEA